MHSRSRELAVRVTVWYALGACLWIAGSDILVGLASGAQLSYLFINISKGFLFVAATALLLFLILRRIFAKEFEATARADQSARQLRDLQVIAEHSGEVLYRHDTAQNFSYISPQFQSVLGYSLEDLKRPWTDVLTNNPMNQKAIELTEKALKTGERQPRYLVEVRKKDGTPILLEVDESPIKDHAGNVVGIVGAARDVTERERSEQALRESEKRFRQLAETISEVFWMASLDFSRLDYISPGYERIWGRSCESLYQDPKSWWDAVHPDDKERTRQLLFLNRGSREVSAEYRIVRPDGQVRWILDRAFPLRNEAGQAIGMVGIAEDVTERRLAQEAVRQSEAKLRGLYDSMNEGMALQEIIYDSEGRPSDFRILDVNPAAEAILGKRREDLVDKLASEALNLTQAPLLETFAAVAFSGQPTHLERFVPFMGRHLSLSAFSPAKGQFAVVFSDITKREAEREQLKLQHSALDAAANAIAITDCSGTIQWVNVAFSRLTGYTREEAIGKKPSILKSGMQDPRIYGELWRTISSGLVWQGSLINKRKDGSVYDEEMTVTPVRSENGEVTHYIAIKQDVTERKRLEQQFLRSQRMQSIGLLAGGVAHDLNNVLAPVMMALPLLRTVRTAEERDRLIETLEQSVKRGANIVQQVLTFARGVEVQRALVQIRHLVREVAHIAEQTFPRSIEIHSAVPSNLPPFLGDPTQIHQVLLNLAVNARDAMPQGGQLTFAARTASLDAPKQFLGFQIPPGVYVAVSVADTGEGIAPELLERVFEPFFTTKPPGRGTGLGLSTVLGIVQSHGGLVEVQSSASAGTTFTIFLPAALQERTEGPLPEKEPTIQGRGELILIVDDEPGVLHVASANLTANGYEVLTAPDGKRATNELHRRAPAVKAIVTDLMMPAMDGLTMTRQLRQEGFDLPIIVMTGLLNPPDEQDRVTKLRELGVEHFLRKPFSADELLKAIDQVLHKPMQPDPAPPQI